MTAVSIIEDDSKTRAAYRTLLSGLPGFSCASVHHSAEHAIAQMKGMEVDVALVDLKLPKLSGIDCVRKLKQRFPQLKLIMLTAVDDPDRIFSALVAGADGYLLKSELPSRVIDAIVQVTEGGAPMSPSVARKSLQFFRNLGKEKVPLPDLSSEECEILAQVANGLTDKQIALDRGVSGDSIRGRMRQIYRKLHVAGRTAAVSKYLKG